MMQSSSKKKKGTHMSSWFEATNYNIVVIWPYFVIDNSIIQRINANCILAESDIPWLR